MTQVDFYILPEPDLQARHNFACRLVEKISRLGREVCINTIDAQQSQQFDELLWAYNPTSFIPHESCLGGNDTPLTAEPTGDSKSETIKEASPQASKVWITHDDNFLDHHYTLINLSTKQPPHFSRFERLVEIVVQEESILAASRERYRFYQERGYPINNHDMRR